MSRIPTRLSSLVLPALLLALPCLAPGAALAQSPRYLVKPILQLGAKAGDIPLPATGEHRFFIGGLTDNGQIGFGVGATLANRFYQGSIRYSRPDYLFHWAKNTFTPIVVPGGTASANDWLNDVNIMWPIGMNRNGNMAFSAVSSGSNSLGTYVWDATEKRSIVAVIPGMPAPDGGRSLTFTQAGGFGTAINNGGDVVLMGGVKDPNGPDGPGLFLLGRDGKMLPIVLPGYALDGGKKLVTTYFPQPSINEQGTVAFLARRQGDAKTSAFLWTQGTIQPAVLTGTDVLGGKIDAVSSVIVNSRNNTLLVTASVKSAESPSYSSRHGVWRVVDGKLVPVATPGMKMPDGGVFRTLQNIHSLTNFASTYETIHISYGVSPASRWGEHVFLATLEDGSTAAYRIDGRGKVWPVLKSGTVVKNLGTITKVGVDSPTAINSVGQIAVSVRINNGAPTLVLLSYDS